MGLSRPQVKLLGLDGREAIGRAANRLLSHPDHAPADGEPTTLQVDLGVEEPVGGDEEPTLREIARLGFLPPVEGRLDYGEEAAARLVLGLEDVASQNHNATTIFLGKGKEILEENGNSRLIPELLGKHRGKSLEARAGKGQEQKENQACQDRPDLP
jgi:hypothetical protein